MSLFQALSKSVVRTNIAVCVVVWLSTMLFVLGCGRNQATRDEEDLKATKGIAFLVIEANYQHDTNREAIDSGIKYSRHWLAKQSADKRENLQELSSALASLILNQNVEFLERMTNQTEHIPGKLDHERKQQLELLIAREEGFAFEWQMHKTELEAGMIQRIAEFRAQLAAAEDQEQLRQAARAVYLRSQPLLQHAMELRISEIFAPGG